MGGSSYPKVLAGVNVGLACVDVVLATLAFFQTAPIKIDFSFIWKRTDSENAISFFSTELLRIHSRISHLGWTRQKVFHLLIGSSNLGYFIYFVLTLVAACKGWACWSHSCGFIFMALPNILLLAAFLLLLSFWVDLCHQSNDDDDDEDGYRPQEPLLEKTSKAQSEVHNGRKCCSFPAIHVGSHQKVVILIILLVFAMMATSAVLIWIGRGKIPIDSSLVARVYVDIFAVAVLLLGGAFACYGLVLFLKMSKVRSERVSSEKWKVAGLAIVTVLCFTSNALVTIFSDIPLLYDWHQQQINVVCTSLLLVLYYLLGSSVPSAFLLWVMRELPPPIVMNREEESRTIAFVSDSLVAVHPQRWTTVTSSQNQVSRASPI